MRERINVFKTNLKGLSDDVALMFIMFVGPLSRLRLLETYSIHDVE